MNINLIFLLAGLLLFVGVLVNKPSTRYGIPGLLLYLSIGLFVGNGGDYDFIFNYPAQASVYSTVAISLIIFIGGLETDFQRIKPILREGFALSTVGVLITSMLIALLGTYLLGLSWWEGLLLGSVLSATDAAAVFSILESKKLRLRERISETLEFESGTNDPVAYFLTISITSILLGEPVSGGWLGFEFLLGVLLALLVGYGIGRFTVWIINRLRLDIPGLYPLLILAVILFLIGLMPIIKGNLLLTMYVTGLTIGNRVFTNRQYTFDFYRSISWLMEISLFIILGLQVFPDQLVPHLGDALIITVFLILLARPVSVFLIYLFFRSSLEKRVFISWVGLRGATPIVFGLIPLAAGLESASFIFNSAFVIVILSVIIQGGSIGWLAKKLGIEEPPVTDEEVLSTP
ncbi:potassium/proton antiporter [Flavilitoribacter nigricans]|uniref:Potassium/proton antiporter n=1 Tax=Flavilitoribacter nigricans (strain ATCC 23147 / DSM 23189 / NBRC 102662 / NCIMB 1420 / SS-2) TaxID=1122177 RepID=A0A2D0NGT6_FLAN2|nr:potassium/proton antiporter [Flavilitoribacter nigricans]PHN07628.1 potassium/proton antiporter [Flavilitoribacter nigricans DSM 23189 = NBRC 102662]